MFAALRQRLFSHSRQVVDVEHANAIAVVDRRVEVARHGNIQHDQRTAGSARLNHLVVSLPRDNRFGGSGGAERDVRFG